MSPLRALAAGLVAGAFGSFVQDVYFAATQKVKPEQPRDVFAPPESAQADETATETVARRLSEGLAKRPIGARGKAVGGRLVHYAFGAGWGALYGLAAGDPRWSVGRGARGRRDAWRRGPLGALAFSVIVWAIGDNVVLPAFRLSAPPTAYPAPTHAYALGAHVAYGAGVWAAFEALRPASTRALLAVGAALWTTRTLPAFLRRPALHALRHTRHAAELAERVVNAADAIAGG